MKALIAYYTGTGGTGMVARELGRQLEGLRWQIRVERIKSEATMMVDGYDPIILLFPLHAENAPQGVYDWIDGLPLGEDRRVIVICTSGMGEMPGNRGGRWHAIRRLEGKGYDLWYEDSVLMPANYLASAPASVNRRLLAMMPRQVARIVAGLKTGRRRRVRPGLIDRLVSAAGESFKKGEAAFGKGLSASAVCAGCGWCAGNCPAANITMEGGRPRFGDACQFCLGCLYGCPEKAISSNNPKGLLAGGYDLQALLPRADGDGAAGDGDGERPSDDRPQPPKGLLWSGLRRYLRSFE
ncbi:MAG: EFR1 family ferrodoxin [Coriobacteriales bacterium]|nr:EFR1 family ferrodoxin [Coriobacteriales bacterium]